MLGVGMEGLGPRVPVIAGLAATGLQMPPPPPSSLAASTNALQLYL